MRRGLRSGRGQRPVAVMIGTRPADPMAVSVVMAVVMAVAMPVVMPFMGLMAMPVMMPVRLQGG